MGEPREHAVCVKRAGHKTSHFINTEHLQQANPERQEADGWLPGAEAGGQTVAAHEDGCPSGKVDPLS